MFIFQEIGASGIVLCYGPLALIIFGFIGFALFTDKISTSTYLRNLDPRPEAEIKESQAVSIKKPMRAKTPTGVRVAILPDEAATVTGASPAEPAATPEPDNLRRLEGIGPKVNSVLNEAGITTFSELAAMTPAALRDILARAGLSGINDPTSWPEQATLAAQGKWEELDKLQDELQGGRRV